MKVRERIKENKARFPAGMYYNIRQICEQYGIDHDTATIEEIKKLISTLSFEELCSFSHIGKIKATRLLEWAGGNAPPVKKQKRKTFRMFGKKITIIIK